MYALCFSVLHVSIQPTGILTGSIYLDMSLSWNGFPAENVSDGSVLVVKSHVTPDDHAIKFKDAVLLIRHPKNAILVSDATIIVFIS